MSRMKPLSIDDCQDEELKKEFAHFMNTLGFVPNSLLTMQRVPAIAKSVIQMNKAVFSPNGQVDLGFKRLVAHIASQAAGCQYCKAHTSVSATRFGISEEKMRDVYTYNQSPLFSKKERIALDYALAAAVPNDVTDELYGHLCEHWNEEEIVELLGVIGMFGFFNRWNDSMATPLEEEPLAAAEHLIADKGWSVGKHR
ncbi:MAG TPA: carboxymuconolactone decarboxylase family protein [Cycloclasticus sp.]|nr:carboxymuconolactone decarboxylase family protein [Cycloclasticus sp.]HIL91645.1 carboxymuconolactone decarboxylase family protein [Cycloclasticus sp.]